MKMRGKAIGIGAALLFCAASGYAADQLLLGKKLLVKNPPSGTTNNKAVHLAKDSTVVVLAAGSAGDPQCTGAGGGGASSIRFKASGGAGDVTIPLACTGWTTNGANSLYKYKDTSGATCKIVLVKNGVLAKAVCKGAQVAITDQAGMAPVGVVTTLNTERYCTSFGGTLKKDGSDGKTFLAKDAPAPSACASPSGAFLDASSIL
jgi:hypothetical protein